MPSEEIVLNVKLKSMRCEHRRTFDNGEIGGKCPSILDNLAEKVVDSDIDFWYDKVQVDKFFLDFYNEEFLT